MKTAELSIALDHAAVDATTAAFDRLRSSIEAVNAELEKLGDKDHGGITITAVGSLVSCEVKPAEPVIVNTVINPERDF